MSEATSRPTPIRKALRGFAAAVAGKTAQLLEAVEAGDCLQATELKPPTAAMRKPPKATKSKLF